MDYDHLFAYLKTRPIEEKKNCMHKIIELVRHHASEETESVDPCSEESIVLRANVIQKEISNLLMEKHMWTQQAVWNRFGTRSIEIINPVELSNETSPLLTEPKVAQYILAVNKANNHNHSSAGEHGHFAKKAKVVLEQNFGTITQDALHAGSLASPKLRSHAAASVTSAAYTGQCSETEQASDDDMSCSDITKPSVHTVISRKRERTHKKEEKKRRARWTTARIAALVQAVNDHKEERGWEGVAEAVGNGITVQQCMGKWHIMKARERGLKFKRKWTADEIQTLREAVQTHQQQAHTDEGEEVISWKEVGRVVNRYPADCRHTYAALQGKKL